MDDRQNSADRVAAPEVPEVSVVLVNYNGQKHLEYCIPALLLTAGVSFEIIVVDNDSSDGSKQWLAETYPDIRIIALDDNTGFGYANRKGIEAAQSDFVALLNTDTEVTPTWLSALLEVMKAQPDVAAACSELRLRTQPGIINAQGGGMTWVGVGFDHGLGYPVSQGNGMACRETLFPTAAAMLMKRSVFNVVGGFDPEYFMYHEDVDLGWRFWIHGYRVLLCPSSVVYHQYGGTTRSHQSDDFAFRLGLRHSLRALLKNYSLPYALVIVPCFFLTLVLKGQTHKLPGILGWNLARWRNTMRARRTIQRQRKTTDREIFRKQLIDFPFLFPRQPRTVRPGCFMPALDGLLVNHLLDLSKGSADGRLGMGWSDRIDDRDARCVLDQAVCVMRVEPECRGALEISINKPVDCERVRLLVNQAHKIVLQVGEGWGSCCVPDIVSDSVGGVVLEFRSEGEGLPAVESIRFVPDRAGSQQETMSVVIPTYNRLDCLREVLESLENQTLLPVDVVVVDDGSENDTVAFLREWASGAGNFKRCSVRQENKGPAAARNRGVAEATGDYVVFIGDDTIPAPDFLSIHREAHREQGPGNAIVGYTDWDRASLDVTPFMEFINNYGFQFGYALVPPKTEATYHFFYTSNISVERESLVRFPFDEAFRYAGWEDTELGYRLGTAGQRIIYYPAARTVHRHEHNVLTFTRRQLLMGKLSLLFADRCPELRNALVPVMTIGNRVSLISGKPYEWLQAALHRLDQKGVEFPRWLWTRYLRYFYLKGYFLERREQRRHSA